MTSDNERVPIAELEEFGLSYWMLNKLEDEFGAIYLDELLNVDPIEFKQLDLVGEERITELWSAMIRRIIGDKQPLPFQRFDAVTARLVVENHMDDMARGCADYSYKQKGD